MLNKIENKYFEGERPLFEISNAEIMNTTFGLGESALKEARNIRVSDSEFINKYVLWHVKDAIIENTHFAVESRSSIWYSHFIHMKNVQVDAPKIFRDSTNITIHDSQLLTDESFWDVQNIDIKDSKVTGTYTFLHSQNIRVENTVLDGNYIFQHAQNIELHNVQISSKDTLWNCENVTVYDSVLRGEYLGWYSKNMRFVNCTIIGTQPLCYIEDLKVENCTFVDADLSFEMSTLHATINGEVESIRNPKSGYIKVDSVNTLILDEVSKQNVNIEVGSGTYKNV